MAELLGRYPLIGLVPAHAEGPNEIQAAVGARGTGPAVLNSAEDLNRLAVER